MAAYKKKGFSIGIFIFLVMQFMSPPSGLSEVGWDVASVAVLMAIWWATETVPVAITCLLYTSPSPRDRQKSRMPSSA